MSSRTSNTIPHDVVFIVDGDPDLEQKTIAIVERLGLVARPAVDRVTQHVGRYNRLSHYRSRNSAATVGWPPSWQGVRPLAGSCHQRSHRRRGHKAIGSFRWLKGRFVTMN
jgi:hypothetical protein